MWAYVCHRVCVCVSWRTVLVLSSLFLHCVWENKLRLSGLAPSTFPARAICKPLLLFQEILIIICKNSYYVSDSSGELGILGILKEDEGIPCVVQTGLKLLDPSIVQSLPPKYLGPQIRGLQLKIELLNTQ